VAKGEGDTTRIGFKASVVLQEPISEEDFFRFCAAQLPGYKRPDQVSFVSSLPKTPLGKKLRQ